HLFGDNPYNDITSEKFKEKVAQTQYDFLLAGFPCQTFSRVGLQEGFENIEKGQIFFHIADIISRTRPFGFFLENVDRLTTHDGGKTFEVIADTLVNELGYHVIGITEADDGSLEYNVKNFIRNSRDFGVPQNRPRTYLIGFDTERFSKEKLASLPQELPLTREGV
ncbi:DNA (cytosine-5-)-methyltransferase, partial [Romboutsia ilealis]|nr:DNA (cytosine-5-)-methyltransferase [Romboutsia ilealis]